MSKPTGRPCGRPCGEDLVFAQEIGISKGTVIRLGGAAKLRALNADALAILLKPYEYGGSRTVKVGGLKARGYLTRKRGVQTQQFLVPPRVDMGDIELLMADQDLAAVGLEGAE